MNELKPRENAPMEITESLRQAIRAMNVEQGLSGYATVCCLEDIPEEEMREMLMGRVLRTVTNNLPAGYDWKNQDLLWVLAEEVHAVIEKVLAYDMAKLGRAVEFAEMTETGRPN
jgi:hypothetical protein